MADPVLHVIAGPNGAGKTTFYARVLEPATHLELVNADIIATARWPGTEVEHGYEASAIAAVERAERIRAHRSFATETVFSHESKVTLLREAEAAGYRVSLHIVLIPEDLAVARVVERVAHGGHHVPENKIRERFARLWGHLHDAVDFVDDAHVYDNSRAATPFTLVASFRDGRLVNTARWPSWTPAELRTSRR